jgi:hypothetical protein
MRNLKEQTELDSFSVKKSLPIYHRFPRIKKIISKFLLVSLLLFINISGTPSISGTCTEERPTEIEISPEDVYVESFQEKFRIKLIQEVQGYITKIAPDSKLTPEYLVSKCLDYDTDIVFVLSQALLESHFGTRGKAALTNSVWNVGTYDNGKILYSYETPDESIEPYLQLLKDKYLINITEKGDTIYKDLHHLVQDRGYINYQGKRFASARGYEDGLRKLMIKIDMETSISFYQDILSLERSQILAYFVIPENPKSNYRNLQAMN